MWDTIRPGQILLSKGSVIKIGQRVIFTEWKEHVVESVTKVFYTIDGKKFRKSQKGSDGWNRFYFPGVDSAPLSATTTVDKEKSINYTRVVSSVSFIGHTSLDKIVDLEKAIKLAEKLKDVLDEIHEQPKI